MSQQQDNPHTEKADNLTGLRCPKCDYELTGLRQCQCPECGEQFDLAILRDSKCHITEGRHSRWRSARFLLVMEVVLIFLQFVGLVSLSTNPSARVMPQWLEFALYFATFPGAVIGQPIILLISLVQVDRARVAGDDRAVAASGISALFSFIGILMLLHLLSQTYR